MEAMVKMKIKFSISLWQGHFAIIIFAPCAQVRY